MVRENFLHSRFSPEQALCIYLLGRDKRNGLDCPKSPYEEIARTVNQLWYENQANVTPGEVRSLIRHCYDKDLHMFDFLDPAHEKSLRKHLTN
jgi:hypothetical protein